MKEKTFEEKLKRLEEIKNIFEKDDIMLEEASKLYKEGIKLSKELEDYINEKEMEIQEI